MRYDAVEAGCLIGVLAAPRFAAQLLQFFNALGLSFGPCAHGRTASLYIHVVEDGASTECSEQKTGGDARMEHEAEHESGHSGRQVTYRTRRS